MQNENCPHLKTILPSMSANDLPFAIFNACSNVKRFGGKADWGGASVNGWEDFFATANCSAAVAISCPFAFIRRRNHLDIKYTFLRGLSTSKKFPRIFRGALIKTLTRCKAGITCAIKLTGR
jgi:hypothetical protein